MGANVNMELDCSDSNPSGVSPLIFRNYMSYTNPGYCRDSFSPEQVKRMRFHLLNHPEISGRTANSVLPSGNISSISGDIVIKSGTVEITDPLYMLPGAKITVKKGARLKIYDKITAACGGMWEGIVVEGTPGGSQSVSSSTNASQGWVSLYSDGEIEHARIGIRLETEDGGFGGGGILRPCYGKFTNCTTSIKFGANLSPVSNRAFIHGADFLLDDDYRGGSSPQPIFIDLLFNTMVHIQVCSFLDDRSGCDNAVGIDAKASSVNTWNNEYENLAVGIRLNQQLLGASIVNISTFTNCSKGIETIKSSKFTIYNNDFLLGTPATCATAGESVGVTLMGNTAGFTLTKNSFSKYGEGDAIGTKIQNTQDGINNTIFDNDYTNLTIGNLALGYNGEAAGMTYVCNTHMNSKDDYIVEVSASIQTQQKYVDANAEDKATGNLFSGVSGKGSFNNSNGTTEYFFAGSANDANPEHFSYNGAIYSGITGTISPSNGDCVTSLPCHPCPPDSPSTSVRKEDYYEKRQERNDKIDTLATLTHPGKIAAIQDSISNLKQVLDRQSSYIIQSFAQDTTDAATILTDSVLVWLKNSETYSADLELANFYFFYGKLGKFDTLWAQIPTTYDLAGDYLSEFEELGLVYDLLRPSITGEDDFTHLDEPILDSLAFWKSWCSEPGFLAKSVLRWNGIESVQDCDDPQRVADRDATFRKEGIKIPTSDINIYPNPADQTLTIAFKQETMDAAVSFFDAQGRLFKSTRFQPVDSHASISIGDLPVGLYFIKIQPGKERPHFAKLEILR